MKSSFILPLDAFVRAVGVNRRTPHAMFLGAGASISSGIPSAQMCIWEWKRDIFLTNNFGLEKQFSELSLASTRQQIQQWLDKQGIYPAEGAPEEYSVYIEACFPIPDTRRAFFQEKIRKVQPHTGYKILCLLAEQELVTSIWTTNFDGLVARAAGTYSLSPIEVGIDSQERVVRSAKRGELLVVSLHGDYRYDKLKNTTEELKRQEAQLEATLTEEFKNVPIVVCGYSGRDASIMAAFSASVGCKGGGALYWCAQDPSAVPSAVNDLVELARKYGRTAYIVPIQSFDDLMTRLSLHCLDESERVRAMEIIKINSRSSLPRQSFKIEALQPTSVIKSNSFEIECPSEVLSFELNHWPAKEVWNWIRRQTEGKQVVAIPFKGRILAIGTIDEVRACFAPNIKDIIQRVRAPDADFRYEDGAIVWLMRESLIRSMAKECAVRSDGRTELWLPEFRVERHAGAQYQIHESVRLALRHVGDRQVLVLKPSIKVLSLDGEPVPREIAEAIKLSILGWQHNKEFNEAVNQWRAKLLRGSTAQTIYEYPPDCGSTFRFLIRRAPLFAEICGGGRAPLVITQKLRPLLRQRGLQVQEPQLLFSNKSGTGTVVDVHPVRGVINNRPYDYPLTLQGLNTKLRLGVVCPKAETHILQGYLENLRRRIEPSKHESDYLPAFPGFQSAFAVDLEVAQPGNAGWITCAEPGTSSNAEAQCIEIGRNINRAIEAVQAAFAPHVVLIFFPERWSAFRGYRSEHEHFDVHDFVKANTVQRGIGTQFLEQSTMNDTLQCRVWWWLSLAFYVKAMRTPWVLSGLNDDTAFVGLGISVKPGNERNNRVVLGCSHIYSSRGEGLQYRVSQVENPVFFGKNPFLSRDDARRVGEQVRELFFEWRAKLPQRVVLHKRMHFTKDEQLGFLEGLGGVAQVEMLEISIDDTFRYLASAVDAHGSIHEDAYPVPRGTVVKLDDFTALVWVHGATSAINPSRRYYQGKRRIPAPLLVRRHVGESDIRIISEEILGLSKMNWNTFDFYTRLPATVQSSNAIARIGPLIDNYAARSYDFRLFI